jgi:hypothetical protein
MPISTSAGCRADSGLPTRPAVCPQRLPAGLRRCSWRRVAVDAVQCRMCHCRCCYRCSRESCCQRSDQAAARLNGCFPAQRQLLPLGQAPLPTAAAAVAAVLRLVLWTDQQLLTGRGLDHSPHWLAPRVEDLQPDADASSAHTTTYKAVSNQHFPDCSASAGNPMCMHADAQAICGCIARGRRKLTIRGHTA